MGMGGGGGGGAVPPAGLSPLQQQQFRQGNQLIRQNTPMANVAMQFNMQGQNALNSYLANRNKFADYANSMQANLANAQQGWTDQQAKWARGGLMMKGLGQANRAVNGPNLAPGMQSRISQRFGVAADPATQAAIDQQNALSGTSSKIGLTNQARLGLANAQRDMRFGGM